MAKRTRPDSKIDKKNAKRKRPNLQLNDLPEDVLCSIMSLLTLKEAARTSVVSRQWRNLWKCHPNLSFGNATFDNPIMLDVRSNRDVELMERRTQYFVRNVDSILQNHSGIGLDKLKVEFFLHQEHADYIDRWIDIAVAAKVKDLVLNLKRKMYEGQKNIYRFPCSRLTRKRGYFIEHLCLDFLSLKPPPGFDGFSNLKTLDLRSLDVTEGDVECLLSNCFLLERLKVKRCDQLVNLKISHPLGRLKYLNVRCCKLLERIEICAVNLTTFKYDGHMVQIMLNESSQPINADIYFYTGRDTMEDFLKGLSRGLPHIETLSMEILPPIKMDPFQKIPDKLIHLKHLELKINHSGEEGDFRSLAAILTACPALQIFVLHIDSYLSAWKGRRKDIRRLHKRLHHNLKMVEITGFNACKSQTEFAIYILENAAALEVMTINPKVIEFEDMYSDSSKILAIEDTRKIAAKYLKREVPAGVKLVIL